MNVYQLDLFKPPEESRLDALEKSFALVKESCDKVRKGQYAKLGDMRKLLFEIEARLSVMEKNICQQWDRINGNSSMGKE